MLSGPIWGYAKAFGDVEATTRFGRCKHKHSTAAAYRRPLDGISQNYFKGLCGLEELFFSWTGIRLHCDCHISLH